MATAMAAAMATTMAMVAGAATPTSHGDPPPRPCRGPWPWGGVRTLRKSASQNRQNPWGGVAIAGCEPWTDGHGFSSEVFPKESLYGRRPAGRPASLVRESEPNGIWISDSGSNILEVISYILDISTLELGFRHPGSSHFGTGAVRIPMGRISAIGQLGASAIWRSGGPALRRSGFRQPGGPVLRMLALRCSGGPALRRSGAVAVRRSGAPAVRIPTFAGPQVNQKPELGGPAVRRSGDPAVRIPTFAGTQVSQKPELGGPAVRRSGGPAVRIPTFGSPALRMSAAGWSGVSDFGSAAVGQPDGLAVCWLGSWLFGALDLRC